ncbi:RNA 3'-terminal phosphate cyclase-like protein, partial [Strigomonas culicis]
MLHFEGSSLFRHHLVCSILSKKPVTLTHLHDAAAMDYDSIDAHHPAASGIQDYEVNFLKFLTRVTSGSRMQLQQNNTSLVFEPGMILGGSFVHEVPTSRSVTYVIEAALLLLPFAKYDSKITFVGATQGREGDLDLSPDTLRTVTARWMQLFGVQCGIRLVRRGAAPGGGGAVELTVRAVRRLTSAVAKERGRVRRVRGIAYACRTAGDLPQRAATAAKGVLLQLLPDVYVVTDM